MGGVFVGCRKMRGRRRRRRRRMTEGGRWSGNEPRLEMERWTLTIIIIEMVMEGWCPKEWHGRVVRSCRSLYLATIVG